MCKISVIAIEFNLHFIPVQESSAVTSREHDIAQAVLQRIVCLQIKLMLAKRQKPIKSRSLFSLMMGHFCNYAALRMRESKQRAPAASAFEIHLTFYYTSGRTRRVICESSCFYFSSELLGKRDCPRRLL
jgi:hypothetical protein